MLRHMIGAGATGSPTLDDHALTIAGQLWIGTRIHRLLSAALRFQLGARNWRAVERFYDKLEDCDFHNDDACVKRSLWGYPLGWLASLGQFEVGWELMVHSRARSKPWLSFGTTLIGYSDGGGVASDDENRGVFGHGGSFGLGYDWGNAGVSLRATIARDALVVFVADGEADSVMSVILSFEYTRRLPRKSADDDDDKSAAE